MIRPWNRPDYHRAASFDNLAYHRYTLTRAWGNMPGTLKVIGLNPSTADAMQDDPTIRRCVDFADQMGLGGLVMLNVYAFRATDPAVMFRDRWPRDDWKNDTVLRRELATVPWAVCAWTDHVPEARARVVLDIFDEVGCEPHVFGLTKGGAPRHPLYLPRTARPVRWEGR